MKMVQVTCSTCNDSCSFKLWDDFCPEIAQALQNVAQVQYLKRGFLSVVEKHEDCHLECGNLQDVFPGI